MAVDFSNTQFDYTPDLLDIAQSTAEERARLMETWAGYDWGTEHVRSLDAGYLTNKGIENKAKDRFTGFLNIDRAMSEQMSRDYTGGMFSDNIANKQDIGNDLSYLLQFDGGGMLDVGSAARSRIEEAGNFTRWNAAAPFVSGGSASSIPVMNSFADGVEDLLNTKYDAPWDTSKALKEFKEKDFDNYQFFSDRFGGEAALADIVKEARNPYDFFHKISNTSRQMSITKSYEDWHKKSTNLDEWGMFVKNLTINGIINDPDLIASMAISLGLTLTGIGATAGAALTAAVLTAKTAKQALRMKRMMAALRRMEMSRSITGKAGLSEHMLQAGRFFRGSVNWLPERIGPHLLAKGLKKVGAPDWRKQPWIIRFPGNRVADMAEGLITGSLAEIGNQYRKQNMGLQDSFDWGRVGAEGVLEALLSPIINPVVGTGMGLAGTTVALPAKAWYNIKGKETNGWINNTVKFWGKIADPDYIKNTLDITRKRGNLNRTINRVLNQSPIDGLSSASQVSLDLDRSTLLDSEGGHSGVAVDRLSLGLSSVKHLSGLSDTDFYSLMQESVNEVLDIHGEHSLSPSQFMESTLSLLESNYATKMKSPLGSNVKNVLNKMRGWNKHIDDMHIAAAEESARTGTNITAAQYVANAKRDKKWSRLIPPDILKAAEASQKITDEKGIEVKWEDASERQKFDAALQHEYDVMTKRNEKGESSRKVVEEARQEIEAAGGNTGEALGDNVSTDENLAAVIDKQEELRRLEEQFNKEQQETQDEQTETVVELKEVLGQITQIRRTKGPDAVSAKLLAEKNRLGNARKMKREKIKDYKKARQRFKDLIEKLDIEIESFKTTLIHDQALAALADDLIAVRKSVIDSYNGVQEAGGELADILGSSRMIGVIHAFKANPFLKIDEETGKPDHSKEAAFDKTIELRQAQEWEAGNAGLEVLLETVLEIQNHPILGSIINPNTIAAIIAEIKKIQDGDPTQKIQKTFFTGLVKQFDKLVAQVEKGVKNTEIYETNTANVKKYETQHRNYKRALAKLSEEKARQSAVVSFNSIVTHRAVIDAGTHATYHLEIIIKGVETHLNNLEAKKETHIQLKEFLSMLPDISKYKQDRQAEINAMDPAERAKKYNTHITLGKAKSVLGIEKQKIEKYLKNNQLGTLRGWVAPATMAQAIRKNIGELLDTDLDNLPLTNWDNLLNNSNPGEALQKVKRSIDKDAEAWSEWAVRLKELGRTLAVDTDGTIHAARLYAAMPDHFWKLGLAPFVLFEHALSDAGLAMEIGERHINAAALRYNLETVLDIVDQHRGKVYRALEGWKAETLDRVIAGIDESVRNDAKPDSISNLELAYEFLRGLEEASRDWNKQMHTEVGYVLRVDEETGFYNEGDVTRDRSAYELEAQKAMKERLNQHLFYNEEPGRESRKAVREHRARRIHEKLGLDYVAAEPINVDKIYRHIMNNLDQLADETDSGVVTVASFGNGEIDWTPATLAGRAIVDYFAFDKITIQADKAVAEDSGLLGTEDDGTVGDNPEHVTAPGRLNHAAPYGSWDLKRLTMRWQTDQRMKEVLSNIEWDKDNNRPKVNWSPKQREAARKWREQFLKEGTPDPSEEATRVMLFPRWVGGRLEQGLLSRDKAIDLAMHFMMDLPNLAKMFVQDSLTAARGAQVRFNRQYADKLNIPFMSPGSEVLVPFGYAGDIIAQAFASEAMAESAVAIIERTARDTTEWMTSKFGLTVDQLNEIRIKGEITVDGKTTTAAKINKELFDRTNYYDRLNSGIHEGHLNALAAAKTDGKATWKKIKGTPLGNTKITMLNEDGTEYNTTLYESLTKHGLIPTILNSKASPISEADFYIKGAVATAEAIAANPNADVAQRIGKMRGAFELMTQYGIEDGRMWDDLLEERAEPINKITGKKVSEEQWAKDEPILAALRAVFKVPVMRRMYKGGPKNYRKEFITDTTGKGAQALRKLQTPMGIEIEKDNIVALGELLYNRQGFNNQVLLDQVIATDATMSNLMTEFVGIDRTSEFQAEGMIDLVNKYERQQQVAREIKQDKPGVERKLADIVITDKDGEATTTEFVAQEPAAKEEIKGSDRTVDQSVYNLSDLEKTIEDRLKTIATYENKSLEEVKKTYHKKLEKAKKLIKEWNEDGNLDMNDQRWNELDKIFLPDSDLNHKELAYFRGINMMTASHFKINLKRAEAVAEVFGIKDFSAEELSGLQNVFLYGRIGPTADHHRGLAVGGHIPNHTATSFSRVATLPSPVGKGKNKAEYDSFLHFMEQKRDLIEGNPVEFFAALEEYLSTKDNVASLGMLDGYDNPYQNMSREEAKQHLSDLMDINEMLWYSQFDTLPKEVFPQYTAEADKKQMLKDIMVAWHDASKERHRTFADQKAHEEMLADGNHDTMLEFIGKNFGFISEAMARKHEGGLSRFNLREFDNALDDEGSMLPLRTAEQQGFMFNRPLHKKVSFFNKGVHRIHRRMIKDKIEKRIGYLDNFRRENATEDNPILGGIRNEHEAFGYHAPWKQETLPSAEATASDFWGIYRDDPNMARGWRAAEIHQIAYNYARNHGHMELLEENPTLIPYFFIVAEVQKLQREAILFSREGWRPRNITEETAKENPDRKRGWYVISRNKWLAELSNLTRISRNVRHKVRDRLTIFKDANQLAVAGKIDEAMASLEALTKIYNPETGSGVLLMPTDIHKELTVYGEMGAAAKENLAISVNGEIDGTIEFSDLVRESGIYHSTDFMRFVLGEVYIETVSKYLKNWNSGNTDLDDGYKLMANNPNLWELGILPADKVRIMEKALDEIVTTEQWEIDLTPEKILSQDEDGKMLHKLNTLLGNEVEVTSVVGGKKVTMVQRNALARALGGILVRTPSEIKGNLKIALTKQSALMLFATIQNSQTHVDLENASRTNKAIRTKWDETTGKMVYAEPQSRRMKRALGFSMQPQIDRAILDSEALMLVISEAENRMPAGKHKRYLVKDKKEVAGQPMTLLDLHSYAMGVSENGALGFGSAWKEAHFSPILQVIHRFDTEHLNDYQTDLITKLKNLVADARKTDEDSYAAMAKVIALSSRLVYGQNRKYMSFGDHNWQQFLDPDIYGINIEGQSIDIGVEAAKKKISADQLSQLGYEATLLWSEINGHMSEQSYVRNNHMYWDARSFAWEYINVVEDEMIDTTTEDASASEAPNIHTVIDRIRGKQEDYKRSPGKVSAVTSSIREDSPYVITKLERQLAEETDEGKKLNLEQRIATLKAERKANKENPLIQNALEIGNSIDDVVRVFFSQDERPTWDEFKTSDDKHIIQTEEEFNNFMDQLDDLKKKFEKSNEEVISEKLLLMDEEMGIRGEFDIMTRNRKTGEIAIYDVKTKRGDSEVTTENKDYWTKQLSLYSMLLFNSFGVKATRLGVIPIRVDYSSTESDITTPHAKVDEIITVTEQEGFTITLRDGSETQATFRGDKSVSGDRAASVEAGWDMKATDPQAAFISWLKSKGLWDLTRIKDKAGDSQIDNIRRLREQRGEDSSDESVLQVLATQAIETALSDQLNIPDSRIELETLGEINPMEVEHNIVSLKNRKKIRGENYHRKHERMQEMARDTGFAPMSQLSENIQDMVDAGNLDERQARLMRKALVNLYLFNPATLMNIDLKFMKELRGGSIETARSGRRTISIGGQALRAGDKLNPVLVLAHEFSHQGAMNYIMTDRAAYKRFEALMHQKGESLIRKLTIAWHGGIETTETTAEIEYYMENVDEFMAALGSYFIMSDFDTLMDTDFTSEEHEVLKSSRNWLSRIFSYMRRIFEQIGSIWRSELQNDEINAMMNRLFGYDLANNAHILPPKQAVQADFKLNPKAHERHNTVQPEDAFKYPDKTFEAMVEEYEGFVEKGVDNLTEEEVQRHNKLHQIIQPEIDQAMVLEGILPENQTLMETGLTRYQYFSAKRKLLKTYGREIEKIGPKGKKKTVLDIKAMRQGIRTGALDLNVIEQQAAMQYLIEKFKDSTGQGRGFGNQVSRKSASWFNKILSKVWGSGPHNTAKRFLIGGLVGPSGANATYNAMHIIPVWFTALMDDQVVSTMSSWTSLQGTASLSRNIEKLRVHQNSITANSKDIDKIFGGIWSKVRGKINRSKGEAMKNLHLAILRAAEFDEVNLLEEIKGPSKEAFEALSEKDQKIVLEKMEKIAADMRDFMTLLIERRTEIGDWGQAATNIIGWKFSESTAEVMADGPSLRDGLADMFRNMMEDSDYIDPITMFALEFIPDFGNAEAMHADLAKLNPAFRKTLLRFIAHVSDGDNVQLRWQGLTPPKSKLNNAKAAEDRALDFEHNLMARLERNDAVAVRAAEEGIHEFMLQIQRGNITWADLQKAGVDITAMRQSHNDLITGVNTKSYAPRLMKLYKPGKSERHAKAIGWLPPEGRRAQFTFEQFNNMQNPIDAHVHNLINRSSLQMYLPNDAWFVPNMTLAARRYNVIAENVVAQPVTLINDYMRGTADETTEIMMMIDNYDIYGTIGDALNLFAETHQEASWKNMDGSDVDLETVDSMTSSITTLQEKYRYIRGVRQTDHVDDAWKDFFVEMAPGLTKIAFGGNLAMATLAVEYAMNTLTSVLGPQGWRGFFKSLTALVPAAIGTKEYQEVARDLVDLVGVMTQAHVPEYDRPLLNAKTGSKTLRGISAGVNGWGNQMMRPSQWIMESIAVARAQIFRKSVFHLLQSEKLDKLVAVLNSGDKEYQLTRTIKREGEVNFQLDEEGQLMEGKFKQSDIIVPDPDALEKIIKDVGINPRKYGRTIFYMLRAGFLDFENYQDLVGVLDIINTKKDKGTYSPMRMYNELTKTESAGNRETYHTRLDVIGGLKIMEKAYINEILVSPNPFDINTDDARAERLFEIYRRYSMLFNSQLVMRNSNQMGLAAIAGRITAMCALDMMYMMLLRLANGDDLDDLLDEVDESPWTFFLTYGARLPIFGRYFNMVGEFSVAMLEDNPTLRTPGAFISLAGAVATLKQLREMFTKLYSGEMTTTDVINATRNMPFLGDAIIRLTAHSFGSSPSRGGRGRGGRGGMGGVISNTAMKIDYTIDDYMRALIEEIGIRHPQWKQQLMASQKLQGFGSPMSPDDAYNAHRGPESPVQPEEAQQVPQPTPEPVVSETAPQDVIEQIGKQATSLSLPESEQLT